jgi:predicted ribosome quality control (RQC) complex YloA/Tae2 family protein
MSTDNSLNKDMASDNSLSHQLSEYRALLKGLLKRTEKKLEKQKEERREVECWEKYQQSGDTILAHPDAFPRGTRERIVENIHSGEPVIIEVNPRLNAFENAELLFKKARKGRRGYEIAHEKVIVSENDCKKISDLIIALEKIREESSMQDGMDVSIQNILDSVVKLLTDNKLIAQRDTKGRVIPEAPSVPYRKITIEGFEVFIGRNDSQNDELSIKFAKPWDIWMHVAAHSGSHVIIRRQKGQEWPPKSVLEKVAGLTAWFSKARHTSYTPVHVTEARFVRKPRKSPRGTVSIERYKSINIAPLDPVMFKDTSHSFLLED